MIFQKNDGTLVIRGYSKPTNIGMISTNGTANQAYGVGLCGVKASILCLKRRKKIKNSDKKENKNRFYKIEGK
jgi:hypothetical protein